MGCLQRAVRTIPIGLIVALVAGNLVVAGCAVGSKARPEVAFGPDPRVFTLFIGLMAGGYGDLTEATADAEEGPADSLREKVLTAVATLDQSFRDAWEPFVAGYAAEDLTWYVLSVGPPPDFEPCWWPALDPRLQETWTSCASTLYDETLEGQAGVDEGLTALAPDVVAKVQAYAHVEASPFNSLRIIPNLLARRGFSSSWLDTEDGTAYVVLGRDDADAGRTLARETFRIYLDETVFQQLEGDGTLDRLSRLLGASRISPFGQDRCRSLASFARENLARALTLRAFPPEDVPAAVVSEWNAGFVLVPDLYDRLDDYETGGRALVDCVQELLSAVDVPGIQDQILASFPVWECYYPPADPDDQVVPGPLPDGWLETGSALIVPADWYLIVGPDTRYFNGRVLYDFRRLSEAGEDVIVVTLPTVQWEGPKHWLIGEVPVCGGRFVVPGEGE